MLHALFSHYRSGSMQQRAAYARPVRDCVVGSPGSSLPLQPCFVAVETQGHMDRQAPRWLISKAGLGQPANARVALGLDVEGFQRWAAEVIALAP